MFCTNCGTLNEDTAQFCGGCGAAFVPARPVYQPEPPTPASPVYPQYPQYSQYPRYSQWQPVQPVPTLPVPGRGLGIAGLILGILSLLFSAAWLLSGICGVLGVIFSAVALSKAKKAGRSNGVALGGLICGIFGLLVMVICANANMDVFSGTYTDYTDVGTDYTQCL